MTASDRNKLGQAARCSFANAHVALWSARLREQATVNQYRRVAMMRPVLVRIRIGEQIAVGKGPRGDLESKRQSAVVKATHHHDRRNSQHIDPAGRRVGAFAHSSVLRHRLIDRRHLNGRVHVAVKV